MQIHIYIHCFPQIYGDTLNPLDIQGGVVHPPHEGRFFCNFETGPVIKAFLIFSSQNRKTLLGFSHAPVAHFELSSYLTGQFPGIL